MRSGSRFSVEVYSFQGLRVSGSLGCKVAEIYLYTDVVWSFRAARSRFSFFSFFFRGLTVHFLYRRLQGVCLLCRGSHWLLQGLREIGGFVELGSSSSALGLRGRDV